MSKIELLAKIELLNKYEAMIEEMKAEADAVRDAIKAEMTERNTEELIAGQYIVRYTSVLSNRFDRYVLNCIRRIPSRSAAVASPSAYKRRGISPATQKERML